MRAPSTVAGIAPKGEHGLRHVETWLLCNFVRRGCCWQQVWAEDNLRIDCPRPRTFAKTGNAFSERFLAKSADRTRFRFGILRRYLGIICFIAEPCWLVTRIVS
uniref:Uncharacterized protein n=1 Tax=Ananas comosus var. bracteatus TaxID=296719 RepID=A0A6V7QCF9_ANACO|nr:unnamed protein product [Ananas comosus var. bracteatus]